MATEYDFTDTNASVAAEPTAPLSENKKFSLFSVSGIFTCVGGAVLAFLVFVFAVLAVDKFVMKSVAPSFFGISTFVVVTGSMEPTINIGDIVVVVRADSYAENDIITFIDDTLAAPVTHRIVAVDGETFQTKGDANNAVDNHPVKKDRIVGKTVAVLPWIWLTFPILAVMIFALVKLIKMLGKTPSKTTK